MPAPADEKLTPHEVICREVMREMLGKDAPCLSRIANACNAAKARIAKTKRT